MDIIMEVVMARRWAEYEKQVLIENYKTSTNRELEKMFPNRTISSIRSEIKRLKKKNLLDNKKTKEAIKRAYNDRL